MDNVWARFFSHFLENDLLKVDKILGMTFFQARKDFEGFKTAFWDFVVDGLFTTPVYSRRRSRFLKSAFPNKKNLAPNEVYLWQTNFKANVCRNSTFQVNRRKNATWIENDVLPRGTESPFLSALHAKNDTTNLFGYKLGESTENNKALLFFSGKETIQTFSGSI